MSSFASLPPPAFGPAAAALQPAAPAGREPFSAAAALQGAAPLHVGAGGASRALDDLERDFFAALCESPAA